MFAENSSGGTVLRLPPLMLLIRAAALLGAGAGAYLMLDPGLGLPPGWDKLAHMAGFYVVTLVALVALPWHRKGEVIRAVALVGALTEFTQTLTGRSMDAMDLVADLVGLGLAAIPIYAAGFRQYAQRAVRPHTAARRRRSDRPRQQASDGAPQPAPQADFDIEAAPAL